MLHLNQQHTQYNKERLKDRCLAISLFYPMIKTACLQNIIMFLQKIVQQLISERVLKSSTSTQTWDCNALECKRPYGESLKYLKSLGMPYKCEPQTAKLMTRHWFHDFLMFAVWQKCWKTSIFKGL